MVTYRQANLRRKHVAKYLLFILSTDRYLLNKCTDH